MKINVKMPRDVPFEEINCGDVFYAYRGVYMKIIPLLDSSDNLYNAINLSNGGLECFDDGKLVNKLDSELNAKLELVSE